MAGLDEEGSTHLFQQIQHHFDIIFGDLLCGRWVRTQCCRRKGPSESGKGASRGCSEPTVSLTPKVMEPGDCNHPALPPSLHSSCFLRRGLTALRAKPSSRLRNWTPRTPGSLVRRDIKSGEITAADPIRLTQSAAKPAHWSLLGHKNRCSHPSYTCCV